ncbi:MAG: DUF4867 family protein [Clostridiales bacterium]|nr:DUF4867 family protein [Clostridiales bacterium]
MRTIKAKQLTKEGFEPYGSYFDMLRPTGNNLGAFFHDHVLFPVSGDMPVGFSSLVSEKADPMIIKSSEYHNLTSEGMIPLDGDMILYVAPPSNKPVPELTEAFIVPKGTFVSIRTGVWHLAPFPVSENKIHIMIVLPERTYFNDCTVVDYKEEDYIQII